MTAAVTVSVALCTRNGERFLRQQLDSILNQTVLPAEIVISDDASSDRTLEVFSDCLAAWHGAQPGRRVRATILRNAEPLGVSANFQQAMGACNGDVILLCDQDDVWHDRRIERAVGLLSERPDLLLLHGDADLVDDQGARLGVSLFQALEITPRLEREVHEGKAFEVLLHRNLVTGATVAIRRELVELAVPVPNGWLHDEWLAIVAAALGRADLTTERLIEYRQHGQNEVGARRLSRLGKFKRMVEPGSERSARLLARASSLVVRLPQIAGVPLAFVQAAQQKLVHEEVRARLGRRRLARIVPVIRELSSGRYREFGRGYLDAARDLLQPLSGGS